MDILTGKSLRVVSAHLYWDSKSPSQLQEAQALVDFLNALPTLPTVICCDLNNKRGSDTFECITNSGLIDSFTLAGCHPPDFTSLVPDVWQGSQVQKGRRDEIDFIFCSRGLFAASNPQALSSGSLLTGSRGFDFDSSGQPFRSDTAPPEVGIPNDVHGSDHLPVVCDLLINEE
jgi:endonuclease/exonuclease/phosphatase family metal-dependent hydrolase